MTTQTTTCTRVREFSGKTHEFDPGSGWCLFGCGHRQDGRIVSFAGNVIRAGLENAEVPLFVEDDPDDLPPPLFTDTEHDNSERIER
jgi:hypothetical protein